MDVKLPRRLHCSEGNLADSAPCLGFRPPPCVGIPTFRLSRCGVARRRYLACARDGFRLSSGAAALAVGPCRTPCSPRCAIWLLYGIVPKGAAAKTIAGVCKARAHRRETLALPGNRVLTSEQWTGKTLGDHKADRLEFVRARLAAVGIDKPARDPHRYVWAAVAPGTRAPSRAKLLMAAISERIAWRAEYERAMLAAQDPPGGPDGPDRGQGENPSATGLVSS